MWKLKKIIYIQQKLWKINIHSPEIYNNTYEFQENWTWYKYNKWHEKPKKSKDIVKNVKKRHAYTWKNIYLHTNYYKKWKSK